MESSTTTDVFQPPPEAPVFEPTYEDFEDPIAFITKIRPIVEKVGICKIRPPAEWQPPFVVDVENFKFVPRMQKINELEATTRVKLNFLDKLLKFWELQGRAIKIPTVDRKLLDFHKLHKTVQAEGGYDTVVRERKWSKVATKMNLNDPSTGKCNGGVLRTHYEKYLYPFDLFEAGITVDQNALKEELRKDEELERLDKASGEKTMATATPSSSDASVSGSTSPSSVTPRGRKRKDEKFLKTYSKSPKKDLKIPDIDYTANSELKKLQFFGAGPKAALPLQISKSDKSLDTSQPSPPSVKDVPVPEPEVAPEVPEPIKEKKEKKWKMRDRSGNWRASYLEDSICVQCERTNNDQQVLVCDACSDAYHMYCLVPPLIDMPKGDWRCPKCVAKECNKPKAAYGFEQAKRPFTLQEFGEMADQFKADYFQMPVHNVPHSVVEREFWRLTTCLEEDLTVHYGADIHALTMGSGFPTKDTKDLLPGDEKYVTSSWNLNNLPIHEKSVLRHVTGDVSGMKVPWCYVGMCFSSFCWHIEDHWSYSVNYMHWGEPKTWYGVPSSHGKQLEDVMKSRAPELFEQSPDLLHHITTIMNPNLLMSQGIPMVRTEQCAGEFIITFPRAYHAGFNQGYNFAEAVNFCPSDWLPFGRECIGQYKLVKRLPVFSHEELVCKMATNPDNMDLQLAAQIHQELLAIIDYERHHRLKLLEIGVYQADQEAFELIPDDERQCVFCKTTCFMSAICCPCKPVDVACLEHIEELCECPASKKVLKYRYTLEEMPLMIAQLQEMAQFYSNWSQQAKSALSLTGQDRLTLPELKKLILEAKEKKYPDTSLLKRMQKVVNEAEQCANLANQLVSRNSKQPLGSAENVGNKKTKLSISELEQFLTQINELPCIIQESALVRSYIQKVQEFQTEAQNSLSEDMPLTDRLNRLYHFGCALDIDLAETSKLQILLSQSRWLDKVRQTLSEEDRPSLDSVYDLMEQARSLAPHPAVERYLADLHELVSNGEKSEEKATQCLEARPRYIISSIEVIINEAKDIPARLPNVLALKEALVQAKQWNSDVDTLNAADHYPYLDALEELVNKGRPIPVRLEFLSQLESQVTAAKSWRERTARTFLKKNSTYSLIEVLSPRIDVGIYPVTKKRKKKENELLPATMDKNEKFSNPAHMVESFKKWELSELESMHTLRAKNMEKHRQEDAADAKYCLCRKGLSGFMFQCELCREWFHGHCVPVCKPNSMKSKSTHSAWLQTAKENKFLCPFCLRSRRPRLETILGLLVSLQKLPVRLAEGEALQCLTERAMAWQDKAKQVLHTEELMSALNRLSAQSQRMVEQAAREKTEKIINAELQKAAGNPDLQSSFTSNTSGAAIPTVINNTQLPTVKNEPEETCSSPASSTVQPSTDSRSPFIEVKTSADISEHAYSTVSKSAHPKSGTATSQSTPAPSNESPRKHSRKSPLVPRTVTSGPLTVVDLSHIAQARLEDLMMEGDLLEVSLDETQQIWKLLQACNARSQNDRVLEYEETETEFTKPHSTSIVTKKEKKKKLKRESSPLVKEVVPMKRQKKDSFKMRRAKEMRSVPPLPSPVIEKKAPPPKVKKMKKRKVRAAKLQKTASANKVSENVEDDEDCSARKCIRPSGEEVDWVQCDECELWFHLTCLGLNKEDVSADDDFVCQQCRQNLSELKMAAGDCQMQPTVVVDEEVISVVSTPVPSASQSPNNDDNFSSGEAGDGPIVRVTSANEDLEEMEISTTIVRPGDYSLDVDVEGDDREEEGSEEGDETGNTIPDVNDDSL